MARPFTPPPLNGPAIKRRTFFAASLVVYIFFSVSQWLEVSFLMVRKYTFVTSSLYLEYDLSSPLGLVLHELLAVVPLLIRRLAKQSNKLIKLIKDIIY